MPLLVRTPEQIMRETGRDLYLVEFLFPGKFFGYVPPPDGVDDRSEGDDGERVDTDDPPGRRELLAWLAENLPGTRWEPLAPPEDSGVITGGIEGRVAIHFDEAGLARFCERWERDDRSVDPRFQLACLPYESWSRRWEGRAG